MDNPLLRVTAPSAPTPPWSNDVVELHARVEDGPVRVMVGRFAQTAARLLEAGDAGISSLFFPGLNPRNHRSARARRASGGGSRRG
jgi:hypothetical protein